METVNTHNTACTCYTEFYSEFDSLIKFSLSHFSTEELTCRWRKSFLAAIFSAMFAGLKENEEMAKT